MLREKDEHQDVAELRFCVLLPKVRLTNTPQFTLAQARGLRCSAMEVVDADDQHHPDVHAAHGRLTDARPAVSPLCGRVAYRVYDYHSVQGDVSH